MIRGSPLMPLYQLKQLQCFPTVLVRDHYKKVKKVVNTYYFITCFFIPVIVCFSHWFKQWDGITCAPFISQSIPGAASGSPYLWHYFPQDITWRVLKEGNISRSEKNYRCWKAKTCTLLWPSCQSVTFLLLWRWFTLRLVVQERKNNSSLSHGLTGLLWIRLAN